MPVQLFNPKTIAVKEFEDLNEELDFLFNNVFKTHRSLLWPVEKGWKPPTDMFETETEIVVVMDIAGITTNDLSLRLNRNVLILRGLRREQSGGGKRKYYKMEIDFGPFERRIELPAPIDPEGVIARYFQGFLEIRLPKRETPLVDRVEIEIT